MMPGFRPIAFAAALVAPLPVWAAGGMQDLDALERRLVIALGADIGAPGGPRAPIDRRMKLAACPTQAEIAPPMQGAATIRCAPLGWRIRVPLVPGGAASASMPPVSTHTVMIGRP